MSTQVVFAWVKLGKVIHLAAGRGHATACGIPVRPSWHTGSELPASVRGRQLCARCAAMQGDLAA